MEFTEDDQRIAKLASGLLVEDGRTDLSVSADQVVRWRKVADAIPVSGPRRGGRGQRVTYLPSAPRVAAALAVALDVDRNLDRAVLAAFGSDAPVPEAAVRRAADHVLRESEEMFRRAYKVRNDPRSEVPRSRRVPLRHSREDGASLVTDAMLSPLLGEPPSAGKYAPGLAFEEVLGEAVTVDPMVLRRLEFVMRRVTFAGLRAAARHVPIERWHGACGWLRTALDWGAAVEECLNLIGGDKAAMGVLQPLAPLSHLFRAKEHRAKFAPGYPEAVVGLMAAAFTWGPRRARAAREAVETMAAWLPHFRAVGQLAMTLPEQWRPALGSSGTVYMTSLPKADQDALREAIGRWRIDHPAMAAHLLPPQTSAIPERGS